MMNLFEAAKLEPTLESMMRWYLSAVLVSLIAAMVLMNMFYKGLRRGYQRY